MEAGQAGLAALRAVHFASCLLLFGQFAYVLAVSPDRQPGPAFRCTVRWSAAAALLSALAWILAELPRMSGLPLAQALRGDTVLALFTATQFGKLALVRLALLAAAVAIAGSVRPTTGLLTAGLVLLTLSGSGHAGADRGAEGAVHFAADGAHILAAGAWLGALLPLVLVLRHALRGDDAARRVAAGATARFSTLGIAAMAVLLFSGVLNASYIVGSFAMVLSSEYGRLLALKVSLFAAIIVLAAVNRTILMPRNRTEPLMRNAAIEFLLGLGVVAVVGLLGITPPATHAAEDHAHEHGGMSSHEPQRAAGYVPGLGEIMTLQQMRHAKLWFAGSARNWALADYELDELREGFDDVARLQPMHEGVPVGEMAGKLTAAPLDAIDAAIKGKNPAAFARAFDGLTAACNSCHQAAHHGFIRIQRPTAAPFGNQSFRE